jgi:hypothetical protein
MDCLLARVIEADGATRPLVPGDENHVIHDDRWSQLGALPVGAKPFPSVVDFAGAPPPPTTAPPPPPVVRTRAPTTTIWDRLATEGALS